MHPENGGDRLEVIGRNVLRFYSAQYNRAFLVKLEDVKRVQQVGPATCYLVRNKPQPNLFVCRPAGEVKETITLARHAPKNEAVEAVTSTAQEPLPFGESEVDLVI